MNCGNGDEKPKNQEPKQQLSEKLEPHLDKILRDFSELLEIKYGLSKFSVVSFKLQPNLASVKLSKDIDALALAQICIYECGSQMCEKECDI